MTILGLILMAAGFIGVLICAKIQKTNPSIQPVAILCALVMLGGLGTYFWFYWNKGKYEAQAAAAQPAGDLGGAEALVAADQQQDELGLLPIGEEQVLAEGRAQGLLYLHQVFHGVGFGMGGMGKRHAQRLQQGVNILGVGTFHDQTSSFSFLFFPGRGSCASSTGSKA